ncbi:MAG: Bug family tripartite tricarboxylate transporter substrate binding protein [Burkholderiales bacterium]
MSQDQLFIAAISRRATAGAVLGAFLLCLTVRLTSSVALAQQDIYPSKPVRVIVGVEPGGPSDLVTRTVSRMLADRMGQSFVVENRAGAGGSIGLQALASAPKDGYTLGWASFSSVVLRPAINISAVPFDPEKELVPVSMMAEQAFVLAINASLRANNLKELLAVLKENPGKYNFTSPGAGGLPHLLGEIMKRRAGVDIVHIPFKGDRVAFQSLMVGDVHLYFTAPNLYGGGGDKIRVLAIAAPRRSAQYPGIATMEEAGLPGMGYTAWHALFSPSGVPRPVINRIDKEVRSALVSNEGKASIEKMGFNAGSETSEAFAARFLDESRQWKKIISELNLKID